MDEVKKWDLEQLPGFEATLDAIEEPEKEDEYEDEDEGEDIIEGKNIIQKLKEIKKRIKKKELI